jgi:hydroxyacylglutathione hydrolase
VRITAVTETHVHADFLSGSRELAARTGARLYFSGEARGPWSYTDAYIAESGARLVREGDAIPVGNVRVDVIHTPGHTPEHLTFLVTDTAGAAEPMGAVTGDFVFVGDVGRPDLLERAVRVAGSADAMARQLYHSLERFAERPDYLQLWPGHGAGSACGKELSAVPQSTLGYERRHNWAFRIDDEAAFVAAALDGQPEPPAYFADMKHRNASGPRPWPDVMRPARLAPDEFAEAVARGGPVIDTRPAADFAAGHIPGTINIPFDRSFLTWAGSLVPAASDVVLVGPESRLAVAVRSLALIGIDHVAGYASTDVLEAWGRSRDPLARVRDISAEELSDQLRLSAVSVVDVRGTAEWASGHLPGAIHIPLGMLRDRLAELPRNRPLVAQCQSGGRSAIAASILQAAGFADVAHLRGGLAAWERAGHAIARGGAA